MQSKYGEQIKFQPTEFFTKLYKAGILTQEEVQDSKKKGGNTNNSFKKSNNNHSGSKSNDVNTITIENRGN